VGVAGDVDDSDDFVPPPEDEDRARGTSHTNKNGPHRCDWIIPATGERCGTSFSRPYDLIRHQDTIHGNKRKEFRCEICRAASVEKVFSRNDALVRHMRHVHNQELKK
jgi:26S proteasome regulatory subunit N4